MDGNGDGDETGMIAGVEANEGTQNENGDGAGTGREQERRRG